MKETLVNNKADVPAGLCSKLKSKYCQQLKVNKSFQRSEELQQDFQAQSLVPPDVPPNLIAHKVVGDGNCLYHAISVSLVGSMEYSTILRMLTAIELFENPHYYANHPRFREALQSGCPFGDATVFTLALKESGMAEWERSNNRVSAIQHEAIGGCEIGEWSSLMHIMALSTVIGQPIFTIYPSCSKAIRPLLQGLIKPRIQTSNKIADNNCFYILWSRDGGLDSRPNAIYVPNHFVPLFQREQVVKTEISQKDSKVAVGTTKKKPRKKGPSVCKTFGSRLKEKSRKREIKLTKVMEKPKRQMRRWRMRGR